MRRLNCSFVHRANRQSAKPVRLPWVAGSSPAMTIYFGWKESLRAFDRFDDFVGGVGEVVGGDQVQARFREDLLAEFGVGA